MGKPWEEFQQASTDSGGPWSEYATEPTSPTPETDNYQFPKEITKTESGLRGAAQGATLGFGDELSAAADYIIGKGTDVFRKEKLYSEPYSEMVKGYRAENKAAKEANPWTYGTGQFLGSALSTAPLGPAAMANPVKVGAAVGGASALGESERSTLLGKAADTAIGAVVGGTVGKVSQKVTPWIEKQSNALARRALGFTKRLINNKKFLPGGVEQANEVGKTMLDAGVIKGKHGFVKMAEEVENLKDAAGEQIGSTLKTLDKSGNKIVDATEIAKRLESRWADIADEPAFADQRPYMDKILDSIKKRIVKKPSNIYEGAGAEIPGGVIVPKKQISIEGDLPSGTTNVDLPGYQAESLIKTKPSNVYDIGAAEDDALKFSVPGKSAAKPDVTKYNLPGYKMGPRTMSAKDGHISFEEAQKLKSVMQRLAYKEGREIGGKGDLAKAAYLEVRDAIDEAIDRASADLGNPALNKAFLQAKKNYAAASKAEKALEERLSSLTGNRFISITDLITAAGRGPVGIGLVAGKKALEMRGYQAAAHGARWLGDNLSRAVPSISAFSADDDSQTGFVDSMLNRNNQ